MNMINVDRPLIIGNTDHAWSVFKAGAFTAVLVIGLGALLIGAACSDSAKNDSEA
jgi:hypothetical protein